MKTIKKKRKEFSKRIFIGVSLVAILVIVFACVMIWRTGNLDPLNVLIPAVVTEAGAATGFYFNKAKAENTIKLKKLYSNRIVEEEEVKV